MKCITLNDIIDGVRMEDFLIATDFNGSHTIWKVYSNTDGAIYADAYVHASTYYPSSVGFIMVPDSRTWLSKTNFRCSYVNMSETFRDLEKL